jgi:hypothetical protein
MRTPRRPYSAIWLLLGATLLVAGCGKGPVPVLDLQVSKGDWGDYDRSLAAINERQTPAERTEFGLALQEMKFQAMAENHTAPAVNAAVRAKIAGWTVRDVLVLSYTIKADRKYEEEKALVRSIRKNHRLRTKPGDTASANFLTSVHESQDKRLATVRAEIAALEARLDELSPTREKRVTVDPADDMVVPTDDLDERPARKT